MVNVPPPSIRRRPLLLAALLAGASSRLLGAGSPPSAHWRTGPPLPLQVQEIYPTLHRGRIHVAGGIRADRGKVIGASDEHVALVPGADTWTRLAPLPLPTHHPQLVSFGGVLYCLGGFRAPTLSRFWIMTDTVWRYDDGADAWHAASSLPHPAAECMTGVLSTGLHLCGGRSPSKPDAASWDDQLDTDKHLLQAGPGDAWQLAAPLPVARNSGAGAVIDDQLHVIAGRTVERINLRDHHVYDPREDRWRDAAPLPLAQAGLAAAAVGGRVYAFGGEAIGDDKRVFPDSWVYEPQADRWLRLPDMPRPRHGHGAVAVGTQVFTLGGALQVGGNETSEAVDILTIN